MAGEFQQLLPFTWRGRHFPLTRIHLSLAHDLVEHKYWGVDGARVESTGLAPIRISAVIPISNHIFPGKNEKWEAGGLYPDVLRGMLVDFAKRTTGVVQHPEFGEISCKAEKLDFELSGDKQGATEIQASWVETLNDRDIAFFESPTPIREIELGATDLQAMGTDLIVLAPTLPAFREDLASLARKLASVADTVTVLSYRTGGLVNKILYQAHRLQVAINRAKTPLTWPATQSLHRIKAGAYEMRRKLLSPHGIGLHKVAADTTLAGVVLALPKGTSVGALIKFNPELVRGPVVASGTLVRYPLAA